MRSTHLVTLLALPAVLLAALLTLAGPAAPVHAGGIVSVCDEAHLRAALAGGGTVTFSCSGTITLTAEIAIAADTTIDGSGQTVTISGNHAVRVFSVKEGVALNLNALTVADGEGGGIYNAGSTVTVSNSTFAGNHAADGGGGIYNQYGTLTVSNSTFSGNTAEYSGGGIKNRGMLTVSNSTFYGNSADDGGGGGIANWGGAVTVDSSSFAGNHSSGSLGGGGGGGIDNSGTLTVSNSTFSGNRASYGSGGGIDNGGTLTVSNSTFSGNSAEPEHVGGGICNYGTVTVSNSTFAGNSAYEGGGGGIVNREGYGAVMTLKNTIVANSPAGGNCYGLITDGGGNLSYPDTTCPGINRDPMLGPLQDNGGPTWTMALLPGSAAIDAADDATCAAPPVNNLDQRRVARPQGAHCDIGAFEAILPPRAYLPIIMK